MCGQIIASKDFFFPTASRQKVHIMPACNTSNHKMASDATDGIHRQEFKLKAAPVSVNLFCTQYKNIETYHMVKIQKKIIFSRSVEFGHNYAN